jgi:hypothetical protein
MFTVGFIVGGDSQPISAILEKETPIDYTIYSMVNCPRSDATHPGVLPITIVDPHRWRDFGDPRLETRVSMLLKLLIIQILININK